MTRWWSLAAAACCSRGFVNALPVGTLQRVLFSSVRIVATTVRVGGIAHVLF